MVMGALQRLNPPRVLGDITLLATLGEGGMATVYLGCQGGGALGRVVAVKLLRGDLPDHDYRVRFMDEARVVVRLHHNNLVDVRAAGEVDGQLYIAMEAIEGRDLADVWDRCAKLGTAFPVHLAVLICRETLRGLHYAHTFPGLALVHRDVSPSNILVDWAGAVRLADFGLATSTLKSSLTVPGVVFGKVGYMCPEQAVRKQLDGRADVYSLGAVLWEMLTGRPLRASDGLDTDTVAAFEAVPPSSRSGRVDAELDALVVRALDRDPDLRWPTAEAMMTALGDWLTRHAPGTGQEELATFMKNLFGDTREREGEWRARLMLEATGSHHAGEATRLFVNEGEKGAVDSTSASGGFGPEPLAAGSGDHASDREQNATLAENIEEGTVIAQRYRVCVQIGRGGMGTVYLGQHVTVGRDVAIKVLTHEWSRNEGIAERFRAEARAASAAGHPNIVEVFDAGELPDHRLYLVMEFLTGRNLYEEVQAEGCMEVARACHVIRDVGRAIRAAHEVGVIHRDLKPDNVMLVDRGRGERETVKVLDFGISASSRADAGKDRITVAGQALGTPHYMAPEQARGHDPSERFDIYAMGVILFELLIARTPFDSENMVEVMARKSSEKAPRVSCYRPEIPERLDRLIADCLEIDPEKRPADAGVFLARIDEVLRSLPRDSSPTVEVPAPVSSRPDAETREQFSATEPAFLPSDTANAAERKNRAWTDWRYGAVAVAAIAAIAAIAVALVVFSPGGIVELEKSRSMAAEDVPANAVSIVNVASSDLPGRALLAAPGTDPAKRRSTSEGNKVAEERELGAPPESQASVHTDQERSARSREKKSARARVSSVMTAQCVAVRARVASSIKERSWSRLLTQLSPKSCWQDKGELAALRVRALWEMGRLKDCFAAGGSHKKDKRVQRWRRLCEKRLESTKQ